MRYVVLYHGYGMLHCVLSRYNNVRGSINYNLKYSAGALPVTFLAFEGKYPNSNLVHIIEHTGTLFLLFLSVCQDTLLDITLK